MVEMPDDTYTLDADAVASIQRTLEVRVIAVGKLKNTNYIEFKCPHCDGIIAASKSTYNGHIWLKCDTCDVNLMQ